MPKTIMIRGKKYDYVADYDNKTEAQKEADKLTKARIVPSIDYTFNGERQWSVYQQREEKDVQP
jgi:hypothetical protein